MMMLSSLSCYAQKPEIAFKPITPFKFTMTEKDVAVVGYNVINETGSTIKLNTTLEAGMKSIKGDGNCGMGMVLLSKKGCLLSLELTGSKMKGDIKHMPFLCAPDFSKCYYPPEKYQMDVILKR